jgi:class 3 adenylate cyclase/tetratricopeptide (TPR) repeat protein
MDEIEQLEAAKRALEAQRPVLGDDVVDTALRPIEERLSTLRSLAAAEQRKVVTVLFADLVGFTAMTARLDAEDVGGIVDDYFRLWSQLIEQHGGVVEKFIGDAVMAAFGIPVAAEDDAVRAVHAALEMRDSLHGLNDRLEEVHGLRLAMRVGITAGPVLVSYVGGRSGRDVVLVGDTVNMASRLETAAPEDCILISSEVLSLVRDRFEVEPLAPLTVKGKREPVPAYEVVGTRKPAFGGVEGSGPIVGREEELTRLDALLDEVIDGGRPALAVVAGDAGIGKSRLLVEFDRIVADRGEPVIRLTGRATRETAGSAFAVLRAVVAERLGLSENSSASEVRQRVERAFAGGGSAVRGARLAQMLGLATDSADLDPREVREGGTADLIALLEELSVTAPVVVLIEDVHWADDASLEVIEQMLSSVRGPVLGVVGARPEFDELRPRWRSGLAAVWIDLDPLDEAEALLLLARQLGDAEVAEEVAARIQGSAEGNPYYLEEIARVLVEEGVIRYEEGRVVADRSALERGQVPLTLTGALQARLDTITSGEREVADRAAVIGRTFWEKAIEAMADFAVSDKLAGLEGKGLVRSMEQSSFAETRQFGFAHGLLRDVTYEALLRSRRAKYHARAARWLTEVTEAAGRADDWAATIAWHHQEAGGPAEASAWYLVAGRRAAERFANVDALGLLQKAADLAPETDLALRWDIADLTERIHDTLGERPQQAADLEVMAAIAGESGEPWRQAEYWLRKSHRFERLGEYEEGLGASEQAWHFAALAEDTERRVRALRNEGGIKWRQGDLAGSQKSLDRGIELALAAGLADWHGRLHRNLGMIKEHLGDYPGAEAAYQTALDGARQRGDRREIALGLNDIGITSYYQNDLERSRRFEEDALRIRIEMGDRPGEALVLNNLALTTAALGDAAAARDMFARTRQLSEEIGDREGVAATDQGMGVMAFRLGDHAEAATLMERARAGFRDLGDTQGECQCLEELGWQALASRQAANALDTARETVTLAEQGDFAPEAANARRLMGRALAAMGRHEEALDALRQAVVEQEEVGNEPFAASALAWVAEEVVAIGDVEAALPLADEALTRLLATRGWGADDPVGALASCARVLRLGDTARASEAVGEANRIIEERAAMIADPEERNRYRTEVPSHAALAAIAATIDDR